MRKFQLSPKADISLEAIGEFTEDHWGEAQRRRYLAILDDCFHDLANHPRKGRFIEALNLFCYPKEKHLIYYSLRDQDIYIVDILHESMDPLRHISQGFPH
jgi:toxin ParE1/3/4